MKKPFQWSWNQSVYSLERLIKLIDKDHSRAVFHLTQRNFENWFDSIGDIELYEKAEECRTNFNPSQDIAQQFQPLIEKLEERKEERKNKSNQKKFLELLDIDKAIEITLKEYEALRAEVLQNSSEISQLILLGLAAIFTIASIGLAPLSDFLTEEDTTIQMPLKLENVSQIIPNIKDGDFKIYNDDKSIERIIEKELDITKFDQSAQTIIKQQSGIKDLENTKLMIVSISNDTKYYLKITRATNGKTIEDQGIVPSIVIFNWLIPGLSLYLIYRSLFAIKKNRMIGKYIYHRIEQKLVNLSFLKKQYLGIEDNDIDFTDTNNYFTTNNRLNLFIGPPISPIRPNTADYREHLTHIAWQHYIEDQGNKYSDPLDANLIYVLFAAISCVSFVGGSALLMFNFDLNNWFFSAPLFNFPIDDEYRNWKIIGIFILQIIVLVLLIALAFFIVKLTWKDKNLIIPPKQVTIFEAQNQTNFNIITWFLRVISSIILYFIVREICLSIIEGLSPNVPLTLKDVLKYFFLLLIPLIAHIYFIAICLRTKDEIDKLIDPGNKNDFRTNYTDLIVNEMWND